MRPPLVQMQLQLSTGPTCRRFFDLQDFSCGSPDFAYRAMLTNVDGDSSVTRLRAWPPPHQDAPAHQRQSLAPAPPCIGNSAQSAVQPHKSLATTIAIIYSLCYPSRSPVPDQKDGPLSAGHEELQSWAVPALAVCWRADLMNGGPQLATLSATMPKVA